MGKLVWMDVSPLGVFHGSMDDFPLGVFHANENP
jgi:hypothetical protein